ncbi:MAG: hypothetical protein OXI56_01470 [bacterium]|nr:hypothetical protein [bacterium]MDE0600444.1 hypothetical protein [bacterium]
MTLLALILMVGVVICAGVLFEEYQRIHRPRWSLARYWEMRRYRREKRGRPSFTLL